MDFNFNRDNTKEKDGFLIDEAFVELEDDEEVVREKRGFNKEAIEWLDIISTAVIAVVIIFCFIFRVATIDGDSMLDNLYGGDALGRNADKVIITNLFYTPKQGDIVVISRNAENSVEAQKVSQGPIIKRVIATEGQLVNIDFDTGVVYVDGQPLKEDYTKTPTFNRADVEFPVEVPQGCIFVLGDNRAESLDSRYSQIGDNGMIDTRYVLGHAVFRIYPFNKIGRLDNK